MSAAGIVSHLERCLHERWEYMPAIAREASRGVAVLLRRDGDGVIYPIPDDGDGLEVHERIAAAARVRGETQIRDIKDGFDLLLARQIVIWGENDTLSFNIPPRPVRRRAAVETGTASVPIAAHTASPVLPGGNSLLKARTGAMNVAMRGYPLLPGETPEARKERLAPVREAAGLKWDTDQEKRQARQEKWQAEQRANPSMPLPLRGGLANDAANARPGGAERSEATHNEEATSEANTSDFASKPGSKAEGFASPFASDDGSKPVCFASAHDAAAAKNLSDIKAAAAADPSPREGAPEANGEANEAKGVALSERIASVRDGDGEANGAEDVISSEQASKVTALAHALGDECVRALKLKGQYVREASGVMQGCLDEFYSERQIREKIEKKGRSGRKQTSAGVIRAALHQDDTPENAPRHANGQASPDRPAKVLLDLHPEVTTDPVWKNLSPAEQNGISAVLHARDLPAGHSRMSALDSRRLHDASNFSAVARRYPDVWEMIDREPPEERATG